MVRNTITVFSLLLVLAACGSAEKPEKNNSSGSSSSSAAKTNTPPDGKALYTKNCKLCHGSDGKKGTSGAKDLTVSAMSDAEKKQIIANGKGSMAAFSKLMSEQEIDMVVAYINTLK